MEKRRFLKTITTVAISLGIISGMIVFSEPGSTDDPVVTKSYIVEHVIPEIKAYVDEKLGFSSDNDQVTSVSDSYVVVEVSAGQTVICDAGAELILRMGKGIIVATEKGGLADTTAGYDLADGTQMPSNHNLVVPVADGRGFMATTDVLVMIKGGYKIN